MKILITERQKNLLMEDQMRNYLIDIIKYEEWIEAKQMVGSTDYIMDIIGIKTPEDFLNLFNDLEGFNTKNFYYSEPIIRFDYDKTEPIIIYYIENGETRISYRKIWSFLEDVFGFDYETVQEITKKWFTETFNLEPSITRSVMY